jgi:PST family polysaccharide transporter
MNTPNLGDDTPAMDNPSPDDRFVVAGDAEGLKRRSVRGSFATVLSQGTKMAIQIGSQIVLARLLFPAEYGLIAMAYPVIALVQVFNDAGLGQAIVQRPTLVQKQVSALFWVNVAISCLLACLVALLAPLAAWVYGEPRLILLTAILGLTLPVTALSIIPSALLSRHMRFGLLARNEVLAMLAGTGVTIICALEGLSYWSLIIGQFANATIGNILTWYASGWLPSSPKLSSSVWNDVKFGANITLSNLATFVTTSGDNIIVGLTTGKVALGLYDRSYNLVARPINQMMTPMSRVAVPLLSRLVGEPDQYRAAYLQMFRIVTLSIVPAMLVCISNGATLIHVFLGPRWNAAGPIFSWIGVGGLTSGIYASGFWLLISQDRVHELRLLAALAAVINVASYLIGAFWGIVGIAIAGSIGFVFLTTPLMLFGATRRGPIHPRDVFWCSFPFIIEGFMVYAVLAVGVSRLPFEGLPKIIFATLISYGLFLGLSLISRGNRKLLLGAIHSLRGLLPA